MKPQAIQDFENQREARIKSYQTDSDFNKLSGAWLKASMEKQYVYNFEWLGRPIIQYPQDIMAVQELVWKVRPNLIVETGIAHGGSLILSASLLALLDVCEAVERKETFNLSASTRKVIGIDIDIRDHNQKAIDQHPLKSYIELIQGSSISPSIVQQVRNASEGFTNIMVLLDSMHTHEHVLAELDAYATLVSPGSYCIVFDTFVEDMPEGFFADRPWDVGNNPKTAILTWLPQHPEFENDLTMESKLQVTVAPQGFLRRRE